jgi:uncharacterized protein (DUF3820 family)
MGEDKDEKMMTGIKLPTETEEQIAVKDKVSDEKTQETKSQGSAMEWLTKNFVVVSAIVVLGAAAASVLFLISYLVVFDWTLIWFVEYSDLTKLFITFGALAGGFVFVIIMLWQSYYDAEHSEHLPSTVMWFQRKTIPFVTFGELTLIGLGIDLYHDFTTENSHVLFHFEFATSQLGFILLLFAIFDGYSRLIDGNLLQIVAVLIITVGLVTMTGRTFGRYAREVVEPHVTIWAKRDEFPNGRIIMWFSHHVAFYTGKKVIVLPTADIAQVELLPAN